MSKSMLIAATRTILHHKKQNMIRTIEPADYPRLMEIWESAVLHTHDFLKEEDFLYYKEQVPSYFTHVTLVGYEQDGRLTGFIGTAGDNIEMLFIDNAHRGKGIGKALVSHALRESGVTASMSIWDSAPWRNPTGTVKASPIPSCTCDGVIVPDCNYFHRHST